MVQRTCKDFFFFLLVTQCKERALNLVCTYVVLNQIERAQPPCLQVYTETSIQINANDAIICKYCFNKFIYSSGFDYLKFSFVVFFFFSALFDTILPHFCEFFKPQLTGPPFLTLLTRILHQYPTLEHHLHGSYVDIQYSLFSGLYCCVSCFRSLIRHYLENTSF